jgi:hypothetical protein
MYKVILCSTTVVEWFIVAFQAKAEQLLLDCNLAFCNPSSTIQQTQNISHLLSIICRLKHACYTQLVASAVLKSLWCVLYLPRYKMTLYK